MAYEHYFNTLGYKVSIPDHLHLIIEDFQRRTGLTPDGIIGFKTRAKINKYNKRNFCKEVFEPIKPYTPYSDKQIESLMKHKFIGHGSAFNYFAKLNDFDVLHSIGHGVIESGWGTSFIAEKKNNIYGWTAYDSSAYESAKGFKDYSECIEYWSYEYNRTYLEPDGDWFSGNNEYCVNINYASSPIAGISKSFVVKQLKEQLLGVTKPKLYLPADTVPGAKDFTFKEGYSNTQINGIRKIKVDPIPLHLIDNAIRVFKNLQLIRDHFNTPVIISSSGNLYRNPAYNNIAGGSSQSQHLLANASDTAVAGIPSKEVYKWAKDNTEFKGFGIINNTWIHLDLRDTFWYQEY